MNQYNTYPFNSMNFPHAFSQQQIPTANGRTSVDSIKLAPNSSILVADSVLPIIYRCVSDSLGNVTVTSFDISPHKDEEQVKKEQIEFVLADLVKRIERLENESYTQWHKSTDEEHGTDKTDDEYGKERKQSTGNGKSNNTKQS